ncbi:alpha/beta hydrolase [Caballeronia sp. LZ035]|uniref:esterase/lipase family protein n=1 Tax=Caballeronia sp. LZ035 TaxID=3038568 RepID=UPI0028596B3F|nr:alpha/beta hydrolase [Caballeronia sp. LZ035]MDR5756474.1 alpha/beta hydrolase [Caballeronia sp. LZ035]
MNTNSLLVAQCGGVSCAEIIPQPSDDARRAMQYLRQLEVGIDVSFPSDSLRRLTASEDPDEWRTGLYLTGLLSREEIVSLYSDHNIDAMAKLLAASYLSANFMHSDFEAHAEEHFSTTWKAPTRLAAAAAIEASQVHQLRSSMRELKPQPPRQAGGRIALIVHGTWAAKEVWWRPGGRFWNYVKEHWAHLYDGPSPFIWSGDNAHRARVTAAHDLTEWVARSTSSSVDIIAHSHGGNVCLAAARAGLKINRLILLGTPICREYTVNLRNIASVSNVFSESDWVQRLGSLSNTRFDGRTLGDCHQVSNWLATKNEKGNGPGHSDLHDGGTWIASDLHQLF